MKNELIKQLKEKLELFPSDDEGLYQRGLYDGYLNSINLAESIDAELNDKYQEVKAENERLKAQIVGILCNVNSRAYRKRTKITNP